MAASDKTSWSVGVSTWTSADTEPSARASARHRVAPGCGAVALTVALACCPSPAMLASTSRVAGSAAACVFPVAGAAAMGVGTDATIPAAFVSSLAGAATTSAGCFVSGSASGCLAGGHRAREVAKHCTPQKKAPA